MNLTPIYVLHSRPFRNTSLLVDIFSQTHGRVSVVARSARGPKSRYLGQLQLFTPMMANWFGKSELKSLNKCELNGMPYQLNQQPLFCGFYLNELLVRLLHKEDPHPRLFDYYESALIALEKGGSLPPILRLFEKRLLEDLGYGLPLKKVMKTGEPVQPDLFYDFHPQQGLTPSHENQQTFLGQDLLSIAAEQFKTESVCNTAKSLIRMALSPLLGEKPLQSRMLF